MSEKTRIRRLPERGISDREAIDRILDEGFVCHVAYVVDDRPVVLPTLYARDGDRVLLHGSNSMGVARAVRNGSPLCVTVTLIDGLVIARSGFHSSANYRSVVIHGEGRLLSGEDRRQALDTIIDALIPGRLGDLRPATDEEVAQTAVVEVSLDEVSAKTRTGGPKDDPADYGTGVWAGVLPLAMTAGEPEPEPGLEPGVATPDYLRDFRR